MTADHDDVLARADHYVACRGLARLEPYPHELLADLAAGLRAERAAREIADEVAHHATTQRDVAQRRLTDLETALNLVISSPTLSTARTFAHRALLDVPAADTATGAGEPENDDA